MDFKPGLFDPSPVLFPLPIQPLSVCLTNPIPFSMLHPVPTLKVILEHSQFWKHSLPYT